MNPKRPTSRHIRIKIPKVKDKERILKVATEKQFVTYKGTPLRQSADFSRETLLARQDRQEIFKVIKSKDLNKDYPAHLQGCQTHSYRGPHEPHGCLQRNTVLKLFWPFEGNHEGDVAPGEHGFDTPDLENGF